MDYDIERKQGLRMDKRIADTLFVYQSTLDREDQTNLAGVTLSPAMDTKLRTLKKYRPESFYYWKQVDLITNSNF